MKEEVQSLFDEMLDISGDIDRAILFSSAGVLASNMPEEIRSAAVAQAEELMRLGDVRAREMGSQPLSQLVVETPAGYVFVARESTGDEMIMMATGKKGSRVGLVLYDLRTCMRDAREAMTSEAPQQQATEEA